jgi:hypothetical protein
MYEDGCGVNYYGTINLDCRLKPSVPWGHRDAILSTFTFAQPCAGPLLVGVAWNPTSYDRSSSLAAIFAVGCGVPYSPSFTWSQAKTYLGI